MNRSRENAVELKPRDGSLQVAKPARPRAVPSRNRVMREPNGDVGREAFTGSEWAVRLSSEMDKQARAEAVSLAEGNTLVTQ